MKSQNTQLEIIISSPKAMGSGMSFHQIIKNVVPKIQALAYFNF